MIEEEMIDDSKDKRICCVLRNGKTMKTNEFEVSKAEAFLAGIIEEKAALKKVAGESITDAAADWVGPRYLLAAREKLAAASGEEQWDVLRGMMQDVAYLRRGEYWSARMQLAREKFVWMKANCKLEKEKEFRTWLERPDIKDEIFPKNSGGLSPEAIRMMEEALNLM